MEMITRFKDRIDAASYAELYALARGILMDLEAMKPGEFSLLRAENLHNEITQNFEVYLPEKA